MTDIKLGEGLKINLEKLIESRLLVTASSGSGKSNMIAKLLCEAFGKVQIIVIDLEGEFSVLRAKYDFLLVGKGGDINVDIRAAELLGKKLLELQISTIIDLYELKHHERILFVKRFLDSMINSPKELWHPVLVVIDEAHIVCPESGKAESMGSVIDLATRGRKRGFACIISSQRLSKLHKDTAAECLNKLVGRTSLDIDRKRAADELGFSTKHDVLSLRDLDVGEFYAYGTAISKDVIKRKVDFVKLMKHSKKIGELKKPPAPAKIKSMLSKLVDLPKQAEKEYKEKKDLIAEITQLKHELRLKKTDPQQLENIRQGFNKSLQKKIEAQYKKGFYDASKGIQKYEASIKQLESKLHQIGKILNVKVEMPTIPKNTIKDYKIPQNTIKYSKSQQIIVNHSKSAQNKTYTMFDDLKERELTFDKDIKITSGALRMLGWVVAKHPDAITIQRTATLSGFSAGGGTFQEYLRILIRNNLVRRKDNDLIATNDGVNAVEVVPDFPQGQELIELWSSKLSSGVAKIFRVICDAYPDSIGKEEVGERSGFSHTGGTFQEYIRILKRNGLIEIDGDEIKASEELFEG